MKTIFRALSAALSAGIFAAMLVSRASAACGDWSNGQGAPGFAQLSEASVVATMRSVAPGAEAEASRRAGPSIVGLWQVQLVSKGNTSHNPPIPDGTLIDFGFSEWHRDGTEILNSGMRAPATGNFCLGVWKKIATESFELNHVALGYDATTADLTNVSSIHEAVNLSTGGNSYTGTFAIDVYDPKGNHLDHIGGTTSGTRVTVDTVVTAVP